MRPKYLFTPDNIEKNNDLYEYGEDLFRKKGFCVIKNFINKDDIEYLRKKTLSENYSIKLHKEGNIYTFFYKNKKSNADKKITEIGIKIHKLRNSILLQSNADQHLRSYCWRYALDPHDEDKIVDHQLNHSYLRLNCQKKSSYFDYHYDSPGEIQAILYLSQHGVDYNEGGLTCVGYDGNEHEIDKNVNIGDLVLANAYVCRHKVSKISCSPEQVGRLTFFVPIISESHPMFGKTYYFKENKFKLYFKTPNEFHNFPLSIFVKKLFILYFYFLHIIKLLIGRDRPIDYKHLH
tara:strand:+ start:471 stop:1346 length:876 start_codon:yes stop_codon:yes gene_type:complete